MAVAAEATEHVAVAAEEVFKGRSFEGIFALERAFTPLVAAQVLGHLRLGAGFDGYHGRHGHFGGLAERGVKGVRLVPRFGGSGRLAYLFLGGRATLPGADA